MGDGDSGDAQIAHQLHDQCIDRFGANGIKAGGRFIEENDFRPCGNGAGKRHAFLHTAREL